MDADRLSPPRPTAGPAPRVAVRVAYWQNVGRDILRGIHRYAVERGGWSLDIGWRLHGPDFAGPGGKRRAGRRVLPAGLIARLEDEADVRQVRSLSVPTVTVAADEYDVALPRVYWDNPAIGRMGAEHLRSLGLRRLAFYGNVADSYTRQRWEGFERAARDKRSVAGGAASCDLFTSASSSRGGGGVDWAGLGAWVGGLPKPVGVMAATDYDGRDLLAAAEARGVAVPEELAVVGVGDDEVLCTFADPPLSSIGLPGERVGYRAAATLAMLMNGDAPPAAPALLPPTGVAGRLSSDLLAADDPAVRLALRFIRDRAAEPIGVRDVLAAVPLSRRALETRFRRAVGRTLQQELWRARVGSARSLLERTDLPLVDVALRCGFSSAQRLTEVFTREAGVPPSAHRRASRRPAEPQGD